MQSIPIYSIMKESGRRACLDMIRDFNFCQKTITFSIFILLLVLPCVIGDVIVEQSHISATEGQSSDVTLKCIVTSNHEPVVNWLFDNKVEIDESPIFSSKYTLSMTSESSTRRAYKLRIRQINRLDQGNYECKVTIKKDEFKQVITLTVGYFKKNPSVDCTLFKSSGRFNNLSGARTSNTTKILILSCKADIGLNIETNCMTSKSGNGQMVPLNSDNKTQSSATVVVDYSYPVNVSGLDGWRFWCVVGNPMIPEPVNCSTSMLVKPQAKIMKVNERRVNCTSTTTPYPSNVSFQWEVCFTSQNRLNSTNSCELLNNTSSSLTLTPAMNGSMLLCEIENAVGVGRASLNVTEQPDDDDEVADLIWVKWFSGCLVVFFMIIGIIVALVVKKSEIRICLQEIGKKRDESTTNKTTTDASQTPLYATPNKNNNKGATHDGSSLNTR